MLTVNMSTVNKSTVYFYTPPKISCRTLLFCQRCNFFAMFWPKHIIRFLQNTGQLCTQLVLRSPNYSLWLLDHQRFARCLNQFPFKPPNLDIGALSMELRWMALALVWFLDNFTDQDWKKNSLIIDIPPSKYGRSCEKILNDDK